MPSLREYQVYILASLMYNYMYAPSKRFKDKMQTRVKYEEIIYYVYLYDPLSLIRSNGVILLCRTFFTTLKLRLSSPSNIRVILKRSFVLREKDTRICTLFTTFTSKHPIVIYAGKNLMLQK